MFLKYFYKHLGPFCLLILAMGVLGTVQVAQAAPVITNPSSCPATLPQGQVGAAYSYTFTATGTGGGDRWSITSGSLPPGITLTSNTNTAAVISGTPTAAGTYTFTIQIKDKNRSCVCTLTIVGQCSFVGGISNGSISFGNIDPSSAATLYGNITQQVSFTCAPGTAYTVTATPASGWVLTSGSNTIPYTLGIAPSGTATGSPVNLLIAPPSTSASSIAPANFQNAPYGTYINTSAISIAVSYGTGSLNASILSGGVSGTVAPVCAVSQSPGTLTFNINPSVTGTVTGTISPDLQIKCTKNTNFSITSASACGGLSQTYPGSCGGYIIPYTFGLSPAYSSGQGFGVAIPMNISGSVSSANYQNAPTGQYGDVQTVTITY